MPDVELESAPPGVASHDDELRAYLHALRRRLPLIIGITVASVVLATLRTLQLPSIFAAQARVQLAKEAPDPTQAKYVMYWDGVQREYLNTQIKVLSSRSLALEVIQREQQIARELEVDLGTSDPNVLAGSFLGGVVVTPVPETYLVDVAYESTEPDRCARYANALAKAYLGQLESLWGEKTRTAEARIGEQAQLLFQKLEKSEQELRQFLESNQTPLFERHEDLLISRIQTNNQSLARVQQERIRLDAELESIQRVLEQGRSLESADAIARNGVIERLRLELAEAELELASLTQRYGDEWLAVRAARTKRDELKLLLREEVETIRARLQSERDARIGEEQGLLQRARQLQDESRELAKRARMYEALHAEVESNRKFYDEFATRLREATHYSQVNVTNVRVVDPASGAYRVRPSHSRNILLGLALGLALGVALALLLERLADRIRNLQEATVATGLPILGVVPEVTEVPASELDRYALDHSRSVFAESFRRARVQLNAVGAYPAEGCGVLLCSSGVPREGKTVCAINLAIASAQAGHKTLLIDADMRNPRAHRMFGARASLGLAQVLSGELAWREAVVETEVEGLCLLPAGNTPENPAELLARETRFHELIQTLRGEFRRILIDSPPVAAVSDGTLMASAADATLLVVSAKTSSRTATTLALTELSRVGRAPCGILFNQQGEGDVGYYYYSYYGRYTEPHARPDDAPPAHDEP